MSNAINAEQLRAFIERVERLSEEKRALVEDIGEVYKELKGSGFDAKIVRKIVALRKKAASEVTEEQEILALYADAVGLQLRMVL